VGIEEVEAVAGGALSCTVNANRLLGGVLSVATSRSSTDPSRFSLIGGHRILPLQQILETQQLFE
jgi:hypothetical protein